MRIILSRKGFDSSYGRVPSPILDGIPISLPIPLNQPSETTYADHGLGPLVEDLTRGRITSTCSCHFDPDLERGAFGQEKAAQSHLRNQGVRAGDLFLFFGLFRRAEKVDGATDSSAARPASIACSVGCKSARSFLWVRMVAALFAAGPISRGILMSVRGGT